jgi:hypothetical protein
MTQAMNVAVKLGVASRSKDSAAVKRADPSYVPTAEEMEILVVGTRIAQLHWAAGQLQYPYGDVLQDAVDKAVARGAVAVAPEPIVIPGPKLLEYYTSRRLLAIPVEQVRGHIAPIDALIERIQFELTDFNEDSSGGDPRYEIHAENMAKLLEDVLKARGADVPEVPAW